MAIVKKKALKEMGVEEMQKKLLDVERELGSLRASSAGRGTVKSKELRKTVARIKTLLSLRGVKA